MKKTVVTILLVLPFVLMFIISFMAKIMSTYQYVYVDSVCFVNEQNECITDFIKIGLNEEYDLQIKVFPEFASNKNVDYFSVNSEIVEVNEQGQLTSKGYGSTKVIVKTEDGNKRSELWVQVIDERVFNINIIEEEIEIEVKENYKLNATIEPYTALNKNVSWSSSDTSVVKIDDNGTIKGISPGVATITVTTEDGGFIDTCIVRVKEYDYPFDLIDYEEGKAIYMLDNGFYDLRKLIIINDESIDIEKFEFHIVYNEAEGTEDESKVFITNNYLTIIKNTVVKIQVEFENIDYKPTILVQYRG